MRFVIVTGISGAGKSTALNILEDAGYFCVDNLPIPLLKNIVALSPDVTSEEVPNIALGIDSRNVKNMGQLEEMLQEMKEDGFSFEILFLDADDDTLIRRYKETRRAHPVTGKMQIREGIQIERKLLQPLKDRADYILDTSHVLTRDLKMKLENIFVANEKFSNLMIQIMSFGFKYGIPSEADLVFDVRFLPNPYYIEELRPLTGQNDEVFHYVMSSPAATEFSDKLEEMIRFLIPKYAEEGKTSLVIAVGCTGGKHRSVTLARELMRRLSVSREYGTVIIHRDIEKDKHYKG